jgi:hypothetical protein
MLVVIPVPGVPVINMLGGLVMPLHTVMVLAGHKCERGYKALSAAFALETTVLAAVEVFLRLLCWSLQLL